MKGWKEIHWINSIGYCLQSLKVLALFISLPVLLGGCLSTHLMESVEQCDPKPVAIHAAYYHDNRIILDYSVGASMKVPPDGYWASLDLKDVPKTTKQYHIHRSQIDPDKVSNWKKVEVLDLKNIIKPAEDGFYKYDDAIAHVKTIPDSALPVVTILNQHGNIGNCFFSVVYIEPETKRRQVHSDEGPFAIYIPLSSYPVLITLFPFAVLTDIITLPFMLPLILMLPKIDG